MEDRVEEGREGMNKDEEEEEEGERDLKERRRGTGRK